jgi:hypothetical protein
MRGQANQTEVKQRPKRTPVNKRDILSVKGKEPGFVYRIVNDVGDRIEDLKEQGYEMVLAKDVRVGDKRVNNATPEGSFAQVSVGGGQKAFVMRIQEDWYKEDQEAKQAEIKKLEQSMLQQAQTPGNYGKVEITRD